MQYTKIHINLPIDLYNEVYSRAYCIGKTISVFIRDSLSNHIMCIKHYTAANDN